MEKLSVKQELKILQYVYNHDKFLDNGGGRMVFDVDEDTRNLLKLPNDRDFVVKIALGHNGLSQTILEIENYQDYCKCMPLAEITHAGRITLIMEKVNIDLPIGELSDLCDGSDLDLDDILAAFEDNGYDCTTEQGEQLRDLFQHLESINGVTSDNAQVGLNADGLFVAYDYGFSCDKSGWDQCSDTRDYVYNKKYRFTLLNVIMEQAQNNPELFLENPTEFMADVEREFFDVADNHSEWDEEDEDAEDLDEGDSNGSGYDIT